MVATGAEVVVELVNVFEGDGQPVAVLIRENETSEHEFGVIDRVSVCCPLTSDPPITVTVPPEAAAVTDVVGFVPEEMRLVPVTVTVVELPPGPELGLGPLVIFGTPTVNDPEEDALSPSASRVTAIVPPLLGHPAGGLARICVPLTEITTPCNPPNVTMSGATKP